MKTLFLLIVLGVAGVLAAAAVFWSGGYNFGANEPHWPVTERLVHAAMERWVEVRSRNIPVPDLSSETGLRRGARHYHEMCAPCHGHPGWEPSGISRGLVPRPPELHKEAGEWTAPQLFWIVKNGIKMTGMPAWGLSHQDAELWEIVAFVQRLPKMTEGEYRKLAVAGRDHEHEPAHHH